MFIFLNAINNALFCRLSIVTKKEFKYSTYKFFLRKLSLVLSGSLLLNDAVCPSYLFINLVNDILDMVSYNRDKFILPVTIVSKEIVKTSVRDLGKPSLKATD